MKKRLCFLILLFSLSGATAVHAEDLDVYGAGSIEVKPNVLIIFDNSGSMAERDVAPSPYDRTKTYTGSYTPSKIYEEDDGDYDEFVTDLSHVTCADVNADLSQNGLALDARVRLNRNNAVCSNRGQDRRDLYQGNYLNWLTANPLRTRLDVAKEAVVNLLGATQDVDFGLMTFNFEEGGKLDRELGTNPTDLITAVNGIRATTWTPLAETLAEAGLYFAGKTSWFNKVNDRFITYTTPIQYRCQKNYVILMTDGEPTHDDSLKNKKYIDSSQPLLKDEGVADSLLDDVADYLRNTDLLPAMGQGDELFENQSVTTYTIGFKTAQPLLESTARRGGGEYFTAQNSAELENAFDSIIDSIQERNASFVAPVVPASSSNRAYAGDRIYLGLFKPKQSGRWQGNLKAYKLSTTGVILDANDQPATDANGMIKATAQSLWSAAPDGYNVDQGGAGAKLVTNDSRNIYTFITGNSTSLTHAANRFSVDNALITESLLDVSAALREGIITSVRAEDRDWPLGDIVHSGPAVQKIPFDSNADGVDDGSKSYIYVGANDGMLHAFDGDTGNELWAFIPPDQLPRLQKLLDDGHDYFVDGSVSFIERENSTLLMFGERRGGPYYYVLDITDPLQPVYKYAVNEAHLEQLDWDEDGEMEFVETGATLGQSWTLPREIKLKVGDEAQDLLLLTGGYDAVNQDNTESPAATDTAGRAIYAIAPDTGVVTGLNVNGALWPVMTHSILDAGPIDRDIDGIVDMIYAGDLGGNILALRDKDQTGVWEKHRLFDLPATLTVDGQTIKLGQKFMYAPEVGAAAFGEMLYIGTGDREDPTGTGFTDAIYAIPSTWINIGLGADVEYKTLAPADLVDVTTNKVQLGSEEEKAVVQAALTEKKGWYMRLNSPGEKIVSSPLLYNKVLYFTTYTPGTDTESFTDPCSSNLDRGVARLYAIDYMNGGGKFLIEGEPARSMDIGTSIPSAPAVVTTDDAVKIVVGVEGGVVTKDPPGGDDDDVLFKQFFWRQIR
ncbi:pilus assembly protein [Trichloromonas acetexigens]|uniref:PQQ-binding-like beta-propeller repeat protein n=1 Tax=Trichloromonas acetexigens TaxID=38815 RepID=A0A550JIV7_9BACT|nr:PilC/PilY family type IV pilus protein [Desulfuromonas acetexigens]TRO83123.1 PQQ-binding-like beta-propeller repeat protein [Desulfuromonas acetexigens]